MNFENMSLAELKAIAKERNLKGISSLPKASLAELLAGLENTETEPVTEQPAIEQPTIEQPAIEQPATEKSAEERRMNPERSNERQMLRRPDQQQNRNYREGQYNNRNRDGQSNQQKREMRPNPQYQNNPNQNYQNQNNQFSNNQYQNREQQPKDRQSNDKQSNEQQGGKNTIDYTVLTPEELAAYDTGIEKYGIFEHVAGENFGFIRGDNFLPDETDVFVAKQFIEKYRLRTGDKIRGQIGKKTGDAKFAPLIRIKDINGYTIEETIKRRRFEKLTPIFPNSRLHMETPKSSVAMRMVDLIAPIGKGQRGMIVSQPKSGKTTLLKEIANSITTNHPDIHMLILLIDERPEEVTDMKESVHGKKVEVIYSTFDELPGKHTRVAEMVIEHARRLVEYGEDVVILIDSITRLARAYNITCQTSGRTLSGGLDPAALHGPKKFFGAARNMREGGSLTILATALVETGSRMDDVVFEEFKGTGNMELVLDRNLSERRIFPAIDLAKSGTRRDDLLLNQEEAEAMVKVRRSLNSTKADDATETLINMCAHTKDNREFVRTIIKGL